MRDLDLVTPFIRSDGNFNSRKFSRTVKRHPRILSYIIKLTNYLPVNSQYAERILYLKNNWTSLQLCMNTGCNNQRPILSFSKGLQKTCSVKCGHNTEEYVELAKELSSEIDRSMVNKKSKQTCLERYGVESTNQLDSVKLKKQETCMINYGVSHPMQSAEIRNTRRESNISTYGVSNTSMTHINQEDLNEEFIRDNFIEGEYFLNNKFIEYFGISLSTSLIYRKRFNILVPIKTNRLKTQTEIYEAIEGDKLFNCRSILKGNKELDIVNNTYKYAVEFNGLMYHSSGYSTIPRFNNMIDSKYHLNKTIEAESAGYQLYHIFEDEWRDNTKRKIWTSKLNLNSARRIYARKCTIREISSLEAKEFLRDTHLQGSINGSIRIALEYNNNIVSVMVIGKSRMSKKYQYELLRMSSSLNLVVVGGASKMLKYFERTYTPTSIVSYANRRWSKGNVYEKLGFTFMHNSGVNHFYFKAMDMKLLSRIPYQKHKLVHILDTFDENKSGMDNMMINGYRVIYDCGNKVYIKKYKNN